MTWLPQVLFPTVAWHALYITKRINTSLTSSDICQILQLWLGWCGFLRRITCLAPAWPRLHASSQGDLHYHLGRRHRHRSGQRHLSPTDSRPGGSGGVVAWCDRIVRTMIFKDLKTIFWLDERIQKVEESTILHALFLCFTSAKRCYFFAQLTNVVDWL